MGSTGLTYEDVCVQHAMYFYDETVDASDWLLYHMECPVVGHGRGLVQGRIYKRDGTLAVACVSLPTLAARRPSQASCYCR